MLGPDRLIRTFPRIDSSRPAYSGLGVGWRGLIFCTAWVCGGAGASENLLDIYLLAQQHDVELQAAEARYQAAGQTEPIAWSKVLPQVRIEAGRTELDQTVRGTVFGSPTSAGGAAAPRRDNTQRYTQQDGTLRLDQVLYHHDLYVAILRAESIAARALVERDAARQQLILRTVQAYFDVLATRDQTEFANQEKKAIQLQLEQAEARFEIGLDAITDVKDAQASFDMAIAREIDAQNRFDDRLEALFVVTGQRHQNLATLSEDLPLLGPDPADIQSWIDSALKHNLSYLMRQHDLEIARRTAQFERAKHWPTLDAYAYLARSKNTGSVFGRQELDNDGIGVQLKIPLFSGGETYFRSRQADFEHEATKAELHQERRRTEQQARAAYRDILASIARVRAFSRALESSRIALEANEAGLEVGTKTAVDVLDALSTVYEAKQDLSQARYNYLIARLRLRQAVGQVTVEDVSQINQWLN